MRVILNSAIFFILFVGFAFSQHHDENENHHNHMSPIEFGLSLEVVRIEEEGHYDTVSGIHFHVLKKLEKNKIFNKFGYGIGGEVLFAEEEHYSVMTSFAYFPWREFAVIVSPGYEFAKHDGESEENFSMHYELSYTFEIYGVHAGPVLGFSQTEESKHYSFGIHIGF